MDHARRARLWAGLPDSDRRGHSGLGYIPTPDQLAILNDDQHSQLCVAGGDRGGKSSVAAMRGLLAIYEFIGLYGDEAMGESAWIVGPSYEATGKEYDYIRGWLKSSPLGMKQPSGKFGISAVQKINPGEIKVFDPRTGRRDQWFSIKTKSAAEAVESLIAESPIFVLFCEAAKLPSKAVYDRLRSRVVEARARFPGFGWILMASSFEGAAGWYPSLADQWEAEPFQRKLHAKTYRLPSPGNHFVFGPGVDPDTGEEHAGGMEHPELVQAQLELTEEDFAQRFLAKAMPPAGRVHPMFDPNTHVYDCPYDPDYPVYLAVDPGWSGATSVYYIGALQKISGTWRLFDEIAEWRIYEHDIIEHVVKGREYWSSPVIEVTIDQAGAGHGLAHENNIEIWRKHTGLTVASNRVPILSGITRMNSFLKVNPLTQLPGLIVDPSCTWFISEMGVGVNPRDGEVHAYKWKEDREGNLSGKVPDDKYNDGIKAVTYHLVRWEHYAMAPPRKKANVKRHRAEALV